jgi:RpiB/LacA/LacB family sugar-phosphate isomerase
MRIAIGADHAGFELKQDLIALLNELGHTVTDLGTHSRRRVDYPDSAAAVARAVAEGRADRGVLICGSGVGSCVAANKVPGARAATCHDTYSAHQGVEHDDMNVLVLGSYVVGRELARELLRTFLNARFLDTGRYRRRIDKVRALEAAAARANKGRPSR